MCAAPKGNKFGEGHGRPRAFDLEEEAKALIEWASDAESLVLREFGAIRRYATAEKMHEYCKMSESFREAYAQAKMLIGARREKLLMMGKGNPSPFNRYAALYDKELADHEREMKKEEIASMAPIRVEIMDYRNA